MEDAISSHDGDLESLFGSDGGDEGGRGDGSDMESLFGGEDEDLALPSEPTPPPLALPFVLPDPPLALPAELNTDHVSTLPEPQGGSSEETWSLPFPAGVPFGVGQGPAIALDQERGELHELDQPLATGLDQGSSRERELQEQNEAGRLQQNQNQNQTADAQGSGKRPRRGPVEQDNGSRAAIEDGDKEVIFLGSTQAAPRAVAPLIVTPAMHYLELRPRCPSIPPPPRIDLREQDIDKLLPFVHLDSKLSQRDIYKLLDISTDAGKKVANECRQHLAKPKYTIQSSGSTSAESVRIFKLTLVITSLEFLSGLGMGDRWFGSASTLTPKSRHSWPDESTTLTLHFVKLLYRIHRSRQSTKAAKHKEAVAADPSLAVQPQIMPPPVPEHNSPLVLRQRLLEIGAKRTSDALDEPTATASGLDHSSAEGRPAKRHQTDSIAAALLTKVPYTATIRYFISITKLSEGQALSQLELSHTGEIREASYSYLRRRCAALGYSVASISVCTMLEPKEVQDDESWDRAVYQVYGTMFTNHEVRVLVCLHE